MPANLLGNAIVILASLTGTNGDDIGHKVSGYFGSMLSSAWSKTAKTANDATANSSTFLTSAITKVTGARSCLQGGTGAKVKRCPCVYFPVSLAPLFGALDCP